METQKRQVRIVRQTSKYNKYIKWFAETFTVDNILISSSGYQTKREAENSLGNNGDTFKIGNRTIKIENIWI